MNLPVLGTLTIYLNHRRIHKLYSEMYGSWFVGFTIGTKFRRNLSITGTGRRRRRYVNCFLLKYYSFNIYPATGLSLVLWYFLKKIKKIPLISSSLVLDMDTPACLLNGWLQCLTEFG
jgi:hypothetical protein